MTGLPTAWVAASWRTARKAPLGIDHDYLKFLGVGHDPLPTITQCDPARWNVKCQNVTPSAALWECPRPVECESRAATTAQQQRGRLS